MWADFFRDGGIGMFPTALFGLFLLASAALLVIRPSSRYAVLTATLAVLTLGSGALGTTAGFIMTLRYLWKVPDSELLKTAAQGCAESLNNMLLGLMLSVLAALLASIAAFRASRGSETDGLSTST